MGSDEEAVAALEEDEQPPGLDQRPRPLDDQV